MSLYSDYVPQDVMAVPNAARFVTVLDKFKEWKQQEGIELFNNCYDVRRNANVYFLRKMLYQYGQTGWIEGMPRYLYEQLIKNAFDIYAFKGTPYGIRLLCKCLAIADVMYSDPNLLIADNFIDPDDVQYGYLPDSTDLLEAIPNSDGHRFLYLFENSTTDYYNNFEIRLVGPYFHVPEFRNFVVTFLPTLLPFVDADTTNLTIRFYGQGIQSQGIPYYFT